MLFRATENSFRECHSMELLRQKMHFLSIRIDACPNHNIPFIPNCHLLLCMYIACYSLQQGEHLVDSQIPIMALNSTGDIDFQLMNVIHSLFSCRRGGVRHRYSFVVGGWNKHCKSEIHFWNNYNYKPKNSRFQLKQIRIEVGGG